MSLHTILKYTAKISVIIAVTATVADVVLIDPKTKTVV